MKKLAASLALAGLLAACNVTVVAPAPVTVDDGSGVQATVPSGSNARFELFVGAQPVRVDVFHDEAAAEGELEVKVFDQTGAAYAHATARSFFADADVGLTALDARAQDVSVGFPYSINLPKGMGKVYVEVFNRSGAVAHVTVKAVTRNEIVRDGTTMVDPDTASGEASKVYGGAVLFLNQHDTYAYAGADNKTVTFDPADPANPVHLRAVLNKGQPSETELVPGTAVVILSGDTVEVFSDGDGYAGFCASFDGCTDGIDSGEYTLTVE